VNRSVAAIHSAAGETQASIVRKDSVSDVSSETDQLDTDWFLYRREFYPPAPGDTTSPPAVKSESLEGKTIRARRQKESRREANSCVEEDSKSSGTQEDRTNTDVLHDSHSDSRPVQGLEWLWAGLGVGAVLCGILFFTPFKFKFKR
jgi:hypothetical protein